MVGKHRNFLLKSLSNFIASLNSEPDYKQQISKSPKTRSVLKLGGLLGGIGILYLIGKQKPVQDGNVSDSNTNHLSEINSRAIIKDILTRVADGIVITIVALKMRFLKKDNDTVETYLRQIKNETEREQPSKHVAKSTYRRKRIS